jgi:predicted nucleotidyltransferase
VVWARDAARPAPGTPDFVYTFLSGGGASDGLKAPYMPASARRPIGTLAERVAARRVLLDRGVARLIDICRALPDVRAVYVFGSYARGEVRVRSDLDVLVVRDTPLRRMERDLDIRIAFDVPVGWDLIVVTPQEFTDKLQMTGIGATILREARRIYAA